MAFSLLYHLLGLFGRMYFADNLLQLSRGMTRREGAVKVREQ
jgi:hypothetical protein